MEAALRTSNKVTAYCSNVRQLTSKLRVLSAQHQQPTARIAPAAKPVQVTQNTSLLGNQQFPLPGNVGSQASYNHAHEVKAEIDVLPGNETVKKPSGDFKVPVLDNQVELKAVECPDAMMKKVKELFPLQNYDNITVLNVTQKTKNDMSVWSGNTEIEWMAHASGFVESAMETCNALRSFGYWADFIDPSTGKPYLTETHTDATLNVTDDEYRSLGYDIADMGCCRILAHMLWGKYVFVGTIFTNAPVKSSAVSEILAKVNAE